MTTPTLLSARNFADNAAPGHVPAREVGGLDERLMSLAALKLIDQFREAEAELFREDYWEEFADGAGI